MWNVGWMKEMGQTDYHYCVIVHFGLSWMSPDSFQLTTQLVGIDGIYAAITGTNRPYITFMQISSFKTE